MTQNPFELPQQMRDLAEKNVEQARVAFGQFMDAMTQAVGMWSSGLASNEMTSVACWPKQEIHATHHPIASSLYYADQRHEARRRAADFLESLMKPEKS